MSKSGNFDWIVDFSSLKSHVNSMVCENDRMQMTALVIGCGTSSVSADLLSAGFGQVDSLDNDFGCVEHMRQLYVDEPRLTWFHYDMVTYEGTDEEIIGCRGGYYDLVVDKGTFDAVLVEGSTAHMLLESVRLLRPVSGVYLLCSLHSDELLRPLFTLPMLGLDCDCESTFTSVDGPGGLPACVMLARRRAVPALTPRVKRRKGLQKIDNNIDVDQDDSLSRLLLEEARVCREYYGNGGQEALITPEVATHVRSRLWRHMGDFAGAGGRTSNGDEDFHKNMHIAAVGVMGDPRLEATAVYSALFGSGDEVDNSSCRHDGYDPLLSLRQLGSSGCYPLDLFLEDLGSFISRDRHLHGQIINVEDTDHVLLTIEEVLDFLREMQ